MAFLRVLCALAIVAPREAIAEPSPAACSANSNCAAAGLEGECCPTSGGELLVCCDNNPVGGCAGTRYGCCPGTNLAAGPNNEGCHEEPVDPGRGDGVQDPGGCAVDITAGIASITSAAKFITYSVDDCPNSDGKVEAQRACADDITSAITDFAGSAKAIESATYTCGGVDTTCARDITNTIQSLSAASETLICAASDCEEGADTYDAFACIVDIFDTTDTLIHLSKSVYDAVDSCVTMPDTTMPAKSWGPYTITGLYTDASCKTQIPNESGYWFGGLTNTVNLGECVANVIGITSIFTCEGHGIIREKNYEGKTCDTTPTMNFTFDQGACNHYKDGLYFLADWHSGCSMLTTLPIA